MYHIAASRDCPQRGRAIEATVYPASAMASERARLAAVVWLAVRSDQSPRLAHTTSDIALLCRTLVRIVAIVWSGASFEQCDKAGTRMAVDEQTWVSVTVYSDRVSAEAALGLLSGNEIPAYISSDEHVPGLGTSFSILVPTELLPRAQWLLRESTLSERELAYLATGEMTEGGEP